MKVLVTGGAGYIGSIMTEVLVDQGYEVVVFDNLSMGHRAAVHPKAAFVEGDLSDRSGLRRVFEDHEFGGVFHFASNTMVGESMQEPFLYLGDNVRNALNLAEVMLEHDVKRIVVSSTANLFDDPEKMPIQETERIVPGSPYGESKYFLERIMHWLQITKGMKYAALRYFNAAGAGETRGEDHTPETHIIPLLMRVALGQQEQFKIFGNDYPTPDGTCIRDYIHVLDLAQAHVLAFQALDQHDVLQFNLGNGTGYSIREVIEMVRRVTGKEIPATVTARRPGDPAILRADSTAIRESLGWQPQYADLRTIIETAWNWHRRHPEGYQD